MNLYPFRRSLLEAKPLVSLGDNRRVSEASFVVGIDTGGTYTDAVVLDFTKQPGGVVVASAKALTTKGDLSIGVSEALAGVLTLSGVAVENISLLTVSTTLATNAVVEGHGGRVAAVMIGFDDAMVTRTGLQTAFPDLPIVRITGGHTSSGHQVAALDEQAIVTWAKQLDPSVEAVAVSSLFAVRNPDHERRGAALIRMHTNLPVTESVDLSTSLDAPRRAVTAVLNARLIGKVCALIDAVQSSMSFNGLVCPLMVVKGDGSRALASTVRRAPIDTIMSGPAASTVGAAWLSELSDFVMSDIGGTTTDISIVTGGRPVLSTDGAAIGGWRTMVPAIDVRTVGLGGDSRITIEQRPTGRHIRLGPQRIVPLSLLASVEPRVLGLLTADLSEDPIREDAGRFLVLPFGSSTVANTQLSDEERSVLERLASGPIPWRKLIKTARIGLTVERLLRAGLVAEAGLTPSDVAHALNRQRLWSTEAASLGLTITAAKALSKVDAEKLAEEIWSAMVTASAKAVVEACLPADSISPSDAALIEHVTSGHTGAFGHLRVSLGPTVDLVAVGGPAELFYPEVGQRLDCVVVSPPFAQVANAVGAAVGVISQLVTIEVTRDENGGFVVSSAHTSSSFDSSESAIEWSQIECESAARAGVFDQGGEPYRCVTDVKRVYLPGRVDDDGLLSATVRAEAIGTPSGL